MKKIIQDKNLPLIIFGAGIVGEVIFEACRDTGIKVDSFCDNNKNKTGVKKCGIDIIHVSDLKDKYKDANFIISTADINDVIKQLDGLGFSKWNTGNSLLEDFDVFQHKFSAPNDFVKYAVDTCINCQENYLNPDKLFLRSLDVIITERCSLKCKNCSNLMQYYEKPKDCDYSELEKTIDRFCYIIDEINEFRVLGGEPFMNKNFDLTIKRLAGEPRVKKIVVYTNGAIMPEKEKLACLKNDKTLVLITDYGKLSRRLGDLTQEFSKENISFYVHKAGGWTNCSDVSKHNRDKEGQENIFRNCCAKNTFTLSDGKLYRCPFSANAGRLKAVPDFRDDYISIFEGEKDIVKKSMKEFIMEKNSLKTCDYCNGRPFGDEEIEPAIQLKKHLDYQKY